MAVHHDPDFFRYTIVITFGKLALISWEDKAGVNYENLFYTFRINFIRYDSFAKGMRNSGRGTKILQFKNGKISRFLFSQFYKKLKCKTKS